MEKYKQLPFVVAASRPAISGALKVIVFPGFTVIAEVAPFIFGEAITLRVLTLCEYFLPLPELCTVWLNQYQSNSASSVPL